LFVYSFLLVCRYHVFGEIKTYIRTAITPVEFWQFIHVRF